MTHEPNLSEREEVELLLPWYVTGRLDPADRARVERALETDAALARQLALIREEEHSVRAANEAIIVPARAARAPRLTQSLGDRARALLGELSALLTTPTMGGVRWAAAAAIVLLLAQAGALAVLSTALTERSRYQTASGGATAAAQGSYALVRFAGDATIDEMLTALARLEMSIVEGPRPGRTFRVRIGPATLSPADREAAIGRLRALHPLVVLATPAAGNGEAK